MTFFLLMKNSSSARRTSYHCPRFSGDIVTPTFKDPRIKNVISQA
ncbi:hypothetical protein SAMN02745903_01076 [Pseudomonas sp. URMO17WK12:I5]|nr:hypothetical protein H040_03314 [Pseudomonas sp. URMO17WK12:I7]SMF04976.1 hypothetical protein SAMN02745903_01076 [Pseudomonas sp. URMO17WK12:I5]